jgi:ATP/maltotriose-dependent transcriptional regulator MalT
MDYVATILEVLDQDRIRLHKTDRSSAPPSDPSNEGKSDAVSRDALSEREFQVLRLIAAGMSNQEIADELILAVGTVKKHTNNIYRKLKVHSRGKAVARARELGLV